MVVGLRWRALQLPVGIPAPSSLDISHSGTSLGTPTDAALPDCGHQTKGEGDLHMGATLPGTENSMTPDLKLE